VSKSRRPAVEVVRVETELVNDGEVRLIVALDVKGESTIDAIGWLAEVLSDE
jgi:hypothetical protein